MDYVELNAVLFYADYLSLAHTCIPVTDNCKYFYIHGIPINSAFILDMTPEFDMDSPYFKLALAEYNIIKDKYGEAGVLSFIDDICCIKSCGMVDAKRMLNCIYLYSTKKEKKTAFDIYSRWKADLIFTHTTINEDGNHLQIECTKYVYHAERMLGKPGLAKSLRDN